MNIMTTIGNFLIYSARSPENNPNININNSKKEFCFLIFTTVFSCRNLIVKDIKNFFL